MYRHTDMPLLDWQELVVVIVKVRHTQNQPTYRYAVIS